MPRLVDRGSHWQQSWSLLGHCGGGETAAENLLVHIQDVAGTIGLTYCESSSFSWTRTPGMDSGPTIDPIVAGLVLSGEAAVGAGESRHRCQPGQGFVADFGQTLQFVYDSLTTTKVCMVFLPRIRVPMAAPYLVSGLQFSNSTLAGALLLSSLSILAGRTEELVPEELSQIAPSLAPLVSAAALGALDSGIKWGRELRTTRVMRFIDANLTSSELEPDRIAGQFGLSRASLYRLFEPMGGVANYIRTRRLARALEELSSMASSSRSIASVGRRIGYPDAASFSRAFRAQYGMSPAQWLRAQNPGAAKAAEGPPIRSRAKTLAQLLGELSSRRR